ncbi:MAG: hypothetical protein ACQUHE_18965 [Bacteroidia bacterium]
MTTLGKITKTSRNPSVLAFKNGIFGFEDKYQARDEDMLSKFDAKAEPARFPISS